MVFDSICVIGVGLIGGSLALAAGKTGSAREIIGCSPPEDHQGIIDSGCVEYLFADWRQALDKALSLSKKTSDCCVVLAAPPRATLDLLPQVAKETGAVLTDVCSIKAPLVHLAEESDLLSNYVPGHPMAGSSARGAAHASADMFIDRPVVLTPCAATDSSALHKVESLWKSLGADVLYMDAETHDLAAARASHAVHVLSSAAAALLDDNEKAALLASTGYRDTTRVAAGSPELWAEILSLNSDNVSRVLAEAQEFLALVQKHLENGEESSLRDLLRGTAAFRRRWEENIN